MITAYGDKARFRARRQRKYKALRDKPALTKDGQRVDLHINAGLLMDMPHLSASGADGVGLFRTELQFMVSATMPPAGAANSDVSRDLVAEAKGKPVVFRTLDVAATRHCRTCVNRTRKTPRSAGVPSALALDRPGLLRTQVRALLRATAGESCAYSSRW